VSFLAYLRALVTLGFGIVCVLERRGDAVRLDKEGQGRGQLGGGGVVIAVVAV